MGEPLTDIEMRRRREGLISHNYLVNGANMTELSDLRWGKEFIPGRGSVDPKVVFLFMSPSRSDNTLRQPMSGESGKIYDELLHSVGLRRSEVYTTSLVKWWPTSTGPLNGRLTYRPPTPSEKQASFRWLMRELHIIRGWTVVLLGQDISRLVMLKGYEAGKWGSRITGAVRLDLLPLAHPSAGFYNKAILPEMFENFKKVLEAPRWR